MRARTHREHKYIIVDVKYSVGGGRAPEITYHKVCTTCNTTLTETVVTSKEGLDKCTRAMYTETLADLTGLLVDKDRHIREVAMCRFEELWRRTR